MSPLLCTPKSPARQTHSFTTARYITTSSCGAKARILRLSLVLFLAFMLGASAQTTTVSADDPRITYSGQWTDQDNGGHKFAGTPGDSVTFTFQGTDISYLSVHNFNGGKALITIDGSDATTVDESADTAQGASPVQAVLFSQSGLDGTKSHTFQLTVQGVGQFGGPYVEIYGLEVASNAAVVSTSPIVVATTSTSTPTTTVAQQTQTATAVSVVIGQTQSQSAPTTSPIIVASSIASGSTFTGTQTTASSAIVQIVTTISGGQVVTKTVIPSSGFSGVLPITASSSPSPSSNLKSSSHSSNSSRGAMIGGIVGGIVGALLGAVLLTALALCFIRRRAASKKRKRLTAERTAHAYAFSMSPDSERGLTDLFGRSAAASGFSSVPPSSRKSALPNFSFGSSTDVGMAQNSIRNSRPMLQNGERLPPTLFVHNPGSGDGGQSLDVGTSIEGPSGQAGPVLAPDLDATAIELVQFEQPFPDDMADSSWQNDPRGRPPSYPYPPPRYPAGTIPPVPRRKN